jgi:hypothetical protein
METLPWDTAPHLPWQMFMSPAEQWANLPTFLFGEYVVIACALLALVHAKRGGRANLLIWLAALIAGTCNDLIFMALPLVDNFWQGQASIMLTPRLPLYIPCMYVVFMYYPTVAVRRLGLPRGSTAALTGLVACLFYAPYDIVGAKFLWWTWHDTDAPLAARLLGAPVSSSLWVLTFVGAFALLLDIVLRDKEVTPRSFATGFALVAGLTTAMMMVQITVLQTLNGGTPGYLAFAVGLMIYTGVAFRGRGSATREAGAVDWLGRGSAFAFLTMLAINMAVGSPETHVSAGLHQVPGPCDVEATDITGATRMKFLCVNDYDEDFTFACTEAPADGTPWFTVCGKAHTNYAGHLGGVAGLAATGSVVFFMLFGAMARVREDEGVPVVAGV